MAIAAKIFSTLGNSQSLVPLAVKDCANGAGMTAASSVTSKDEGKDRFIDEFGTEAIWIGGIPVFKKIIDKTLFKATKFDPNYDVRNLKNKDIFKKTIEHAPTDEIKKGIQKISSNQKTFKALNLAKFVMATAMTLGTYNFMTNYKQKYTEKNIREKLLKKQAENAKNQMNDMANHKLKNNVKDLNFQSFAKLRSENKSPAFKGIYNLMLDPVKNTAVLDVGITSERLKKSRSPQEFAGYSIKEFGFLGFIYLLGPQVQKHFEKVADKKHNKSIYLDSRVLENPDFQKSFADKSIEKGLKDFAEADKSDAQLFDFIHGNMKNSVVDVATQSDILSTYKKPKKWYQIFTKAEDTGKLDTRKFMDLDSVRNTHKNISKLYKQFNESGQTVENFFHDVKILKRKSVVKNIGSTIFALGVVLPSIMLADRFLRDGNKEFAVEKRIKEELNNKKLNKTV